MEWRWVRRGTVPASGIEQASSNRALSFSFPFPVPVPFRRDVADGVGVFLSRSIAVHCGAPVGRALGAGTRVYAMRAHSMQRVHQ